MSSLHLIAPSLDQRVPVVMAGNPYESKLPYSVPEGIVEGFPAGVARSGPALGTELSKLFDFDFERDPASGFIILDLEEILPHLPGLEVACPDPGLLMVAPLTMIQKLKLSLEWIIDVEREDNLIMSQDEIFVIGAGTAGRLAAKYGQDYLVSGGFAEQMQFLTHQPDEKPILPEQPEFLYYLHNFESSELVKVAVNCYDDQLNETLLDTLSFQAEPYGVYCIPCGPSQLQLPESVKTYEIALIDEAGSRKTQVRTYHIDRSPYERPTIVVFQNSFGVFDVISLVGEYVTNATFEGDTGQLMKAAHNSPQIRTQRREETDETTFKTGLYPPGWLPYFTELLRSKKVAILKDQAYYFVRASSSGAEIENSFEPAYSLDITLSSEVANSFYSL
ncbi:hypothetical protein [Siphonobacter sp. SORGH_AS_0500]|uniref:hypothetical protein n=1 Tax=Siphonobacter sp. SORGH_AS_0500 TaxID=1864824 RepID=UPI002862D117|nr:hypothetical protein [Siphonobacter sp. SORGH_AS_0500]MDR6196137.1 hypothetical protein [Siphonobacter sp. SORGH_AS_0500]